MDPRPADSHPRLPAARPPQPPVPAFPPPPYPPPPEPAPKPPVGPRFGWRRFTRSPRGTAGVVIVAAALLLWPFAGLSWIPWLAGLVVMVLLRLLRLDKVLRNWDLHLAGLVVVAGLMLSTTPWAWALSASIGVLIAGLAQLPWWRLAAVGVVLCAVSGIGFGVTTIQAERRAVAEYGQVQEQNRLALGAPRADSVLPTMLNRIAQNSPGAVCDNLLGPAAREPFAASVEQPTCAAAVNAIASRVTDRNSYAGADAPTSPTADGMEVDACAMTWRTGSPPGPQLGRLTIGQIAPSRYVVLAFRPC